MAEATVSSYDPLSYHVNKIVDLTPALVIAYKNKDSATIDKYLAEGKANFDVFICVNKHNHAFVLICDSKELTERPENVSLNDPSQYPIPLNAMCWTVELEFENVDLRLYRISKGFKRYREVHSKIKRMFPISQYKNTSSFAFELAALSVAPTRYGILLSDCIEFAKAFCEELQTYCDNYREIKASVQHNIQQATATGLSIERLSRQNRSSALTGNSILGGIDASSFLSHNKNVLLFLLIVFVFFWPIIVGYIFVTYYK